MASFWNQFNAIYCINLKERTDRKEASLQVFNKLGLSVTYHEATRDPLGGERGCFMEHRACLKKAYDAGYNNVLIFEDDIMAPTTILTQDAMDEVTRFLSTNNEWELFFLGACPNIFFHSTSQITGFKNIKRVSSLCAHAYIASRAWMLKMQALSYEVLSIPIDNLYMMNKKAFAIFPTWFYQSTSPSNIGDRTQATLIIAKAIAKGKNMYAQYVNFPIVYLVVVMFLLLLFVILFLVSRRK